MKQPIYERYPELFERCINITYWSSKFGYPAVLKGNWEDVLYNYLCNIIKKYGQDLPLCKEEITQQLLLFWIQFEREFYSKNPSIHIKQYIIRRSIWAIRDWISKLCNEQFIPIEEINNQPIYINDYGFILNIKFLIYGTGWYPLSILLPYERYLLFLKYVENKSIVEISYIVQKDRAIVTQQLNEILADFQRRLNVSKEKNSNRRSISNSRD